jgi:hypothetical protein
MRPGASKVTMEEPTRYRVTLDCRLVATDGSALDESVSKALDVAMTELRKLGMSDAGIALHVKDSVGELRITCNVKVREFEEAIGEAGGPMRAALHTAEIGTSKWPGAKAPAWKVEVVNQSAEKVLVPA